MTVSRAGTGKTHNMEHLTVPQTKDILTKPHDDVVSHRDTRVDQKSSQWLELEQFEY